MKIRGNGLKVGDRVRHGSLVGEVREIVKTWGGSPRLVLIRQDSGHEHEASVRKLERA